MTNFNYLKINKSRKIRYLNHNLKNATYIVFLHGFMSNLEGKKPRTFLNFAKRNKMGFLALEYSGHGKSSGKFTDGNISKWTKETTQIIKKIVKKNKIILIGSSMGAWISLNQFKHFKKQINGFLGIGSAPEFLEGLMWN
jgi:pimeloyl-ACP methyl ester carboxylesterase